MTREKSKMDPVERLRHLQGLDDSKNTCFCDSIMVDRDCPVHFRENRWDETLKREAVELLPQLLDEIETLRQALSQGPAREAECPTCGEEIEVRFGIIMAHESFSYETCPISGTVYVEPDPEPEPEPEPPSTIDTLREARAGVDEEGDPVLAAALDEAIAAVERAAEPPPAVVSTTVECPTCESEVQVIDGFIQAHNGDYQLVLHPTDPNLDTSYPVPCSRSGKRA